MKNQRRQNGVLVQHQEVFQKTKEFPEIGITDCLMAKQQRNQFKHLKGQRPKFNLHHSMRYKAEITSELNTHGTTKRITKVKISYQTGNCRSKFSKTHVWQRI